MNHHEKLADLERALNAIDEEDLNLEDSDEFDNFQEEIEDELENLLMGSENVTMNNETLEYVTKVGHASAIEGKNIKSPDKKPTFRNLSPVKQASVLSTMKDKVKVRQQTAIALMEKVSKIVPKKDACVSARPLSETISYIPQIIGSDDNNNNMSEDNVIALKESCQTKDIDKNVNEIGIQASTIDFECQTENIMQSNNSPSQSSPTETETELQKASLLQLSSSTVPLIDPKSNNLTEELESFLQTLKLPKNIVKKLPKPKAEVQKGRMIDSQKKKTQSSNKSSGNRCQTRPTTTFSAANRRRGRNVHLSTPFPNSKKPFQFATLGYRSIGTENLRFDPNPRPQTRSRRPKSRALRSNAHQALLPSPTAPTLPIFQDTPKMPKDNSNGSSNINTHTSTSSTETSFPSVSMSHSSPNLPFSPIKSRRRGSPKSQVYGDNNSFISNGDDNDEFFNSNNSNNNNNNPEYDDINGKDEMEQMIWDSQFRIPGSSSYNKRAGTSYTANHNRNISTASTFKSAYSTSKPSQRMMKKSRSKKLVDQARRALHTSQAARLTRPLTRQERHLHQQISSSNEAKLRAKLAILQNELKKSEKRETDLKSKLTEVQSNALTSALTNWPLKL